MLIASEGDSDNTNDLLLAPLWTGLNQVGCVWLSEEGKWEGQAKESGKILEEEAILASQTQVTAE